MRNSAGKNRFGGSNYVYLYQSPAFWFNKIEFKTENNPSLFCEGLFFHPKNFASRINKRYNTPIMIAVIIKAEKNSSVPAHTNKKISAEAIQKKYPFLKLICPIFYKLNVNQYILKPSDSTSVYKVRGSGNGGGITFHACHLIRMPVFFTF